MIPLSELPWIAIVLSGVASIVLGYFWYSPTGFGSRWMKEMKFTEKDMKKAKAKGMCKTYAMAALMNVVTATAVAELLLWVGVEMWSSVAQFVGVTWLGFMAAKATGMVFWEGKSWTLYTIHVAYDLVNLSIMASLVFFMQQ